MIKLDYNVNVVHHDYAIGNTLEIMLLDTSLFNDLDKTINHCIERANYVSRANFKKFSLSTLAQVSSTFRRAYIGEPVLNRIKQDAGKLAHNMQ